MILDQVKRTLFSRFRLRQEPVPPQRPMFLMHIPKTAGTSLIQLLANRFSAEDCLYRVDQAANYAQDVNRFQFVTGHVGLELLERFQIKPIVVTFLRHPIDRALSSYFFQRSFTPEQIRDLYVQEGSPEAVIARRVRLCELAHRLSLEEFLQKEPDFARGLFKNLQTHHLAGVPLPTIPTPGSLRKNASDLVEVACENLAQCEIVGLTERFGESVELLCHDLGWLPFEEIPKSNATRQRIKASEIDDATREALVQLLGPDLTLYEAAQQLFEQRRQAAEPRQQSQSLRRRLAQLPRVTDYSFEQPLVGAGWHMREKNESTWSCWSGPGTESWLDFRPTSASARRFRCELFHRVGQDVLQSVQVRINDQFIALRQTEDHGRIILEGNVSRKAIESNCERLRIRFTVGHRWQPSAFDPTSSDDRWLGINVSRISLT